MKAPILVRVPYWLSIPAEVEIFKIPLLVRVPELVIVPELFKIIFDLIPRVPELVIVPELLMVTVSKATSVVIVPEVLLVIVPELFNVPKILRVPEFVIVSELLMIPDVYDSFVIVPKLSIVPELFNVPSILILFERELLIVPKLDYGVIFVWHKNMHPIIFQYLYIWYELMVNLVKNHYLKRNIKI